MWLACPSQPTTEETHGGGTHTIIQAAFYFTLLFRGADGSLIVIEAMLVIEIALVEDRLDDVIDVHEDIGDLVRTGSFGMGRKLLPAVSHKGDEPVVYTRQRSRAAFPDAIVMAPFQG